MDPLAMAAKLEALCLAGPDRQGTVGTLKQRICTFYSREFSSPGFASSTAIVSLPCDSMVTQNYDQLIEKACSCWNISYPYHKKELSVIRILISRSEETNSGF